MTWRVRLTEGLLQDVDAMHEWIASRGSPWSAERWIARLMVALRSLEWSPTRCPPAREADLFPEHEMRQLVFGRIRVLFTIAGNEVIVLHARHGSRRDASRDEIEQVLDEMGPGDQPE